MVILSFFLMLPYRFVGVHFATGMIASILTSVVALVFLVGEKLDMASAEQSPAMILAMVALCLSLISCALPMIAYLNFVSTFLGIEVIRSIIIVPEKVDHWGEQLLQADKGRHVELATGASTFN